MDYEAELPSGRESAPKLLNMHHNEQLMKALHQHDSSFVIFDPQLPEHPVVYASKGFCLMSGFSTEELVGHKCRFLEGPDTDLGTMLEIKEAIKEERPSRVRILNYTKQGKCMWNLLHLAPLYSRTDGRVILFVGMFTPTGISLSEVAERFSRSLGVTCPEVRDMAVNWFNGPLKILLDTAARNLGSSCSTQGQLLTCGNEEATEAHTMSTEAPMVWSPQVKDNGMKAEEADNCRARIAVMSVISELTSHSGGNVTDKRNIGSTIRGSTYLSLVSFHRINHSFVLVDPHLPDMPIVHASELFLQMTGYTRAEVLGRNCRFLQGPETSSKAVQQIRDSVGSTKSCSVRLLNYRKDGRPFWNWLHVCPVRNCGGKVAYFAGVQLDLPGNPGVAGEKCAGAHHRHLGVVAAIRVAVRGAGLKRAEDV